MTTAVPNGVGRVKSHRKSLKGVSTVFLFRYIDNLVMTLTRISRYKKRKKKKPICYKWEDGEMT